MRCKGGAEVYTSSNGPHPLKSRRPCSRYSGCYDVALTSSVDVVLI